MNLQKLFFIFISGFFLVSSYAEKKRPNLLFIITDQQRFDAMSCAGNTVLQTPNMDRIAKEGVIFKNAYVANPVCVPSRASILTGLSPVNVRVEGNGDYTSKDVPDVPTFDSILKENGYAAEYYGKWHTPYQFAEHYDNPVKAVGAEAKKHGSQIEAYQQYLIKKGVKPKMPTAGFLLSKRNNRPYKPIELDANHHNSDVSAKEKMKIKASQVYQYGCIDMPSHVSYAAFTAEETLEALDRLNDKPFTLTCSFDPPHPPMVVQEPYYSMYTPESIPTPETIHDSMESSPYRDRASEKKQQEYRNIEQIKKMRSIYYGMVKQVDDQLGLILKKLDDLGIADNTMVVFISDHGEMLGDHGMYSKVIFYEGSVHVPMLIRFPGRIKAGTVVDAPVSSMDLFPTILDYMGMPISRSDGISLRPLIEGKELEHDVVAYSLGRDRPNYMIRSGKLKFMMGQDEKNKGISALYDLEADPNEMRNLIYSPLLPEKNMAQAKMMKGRLVKWMETHEPHKAAAIKAKKIK